MKHTFLKQFLSFMILLAPILAMEKEMDPHVIIREVTIHEQGSEPYNRFIAKKIFQANPHLTCDISEITDRFTIDIDNNVVKYSALFRGLTLKILPAEFRCYTELNYLELTRNKLIEIPPQISNLKKIGWIDLSRNPLRLSIGILPPGFENLKNIETSCFLGTIYQVFYKQELSIWGVRKKSGNVEHSDFVNNCLKSVAPAQRKFMDCFMSLDEFPKDIFLPEIKKMIYGYVYELCLKDIFYFNRDTIITSWPFY